tara:strand:- start:83 stop:265 length:183 start_codon:yes stop_codon:yes gene_type:complete
MILLRRKEEKMSSKDIALRVPVKMFDDLNRIAKNENRPRARVMREMLERGIEERAKNGSK